MQKMENAKMKMKNTKSVIFRHFLIATLLAFVSCLTVPVWAQVGQATLIGTVEDTTGAVVTGATITLTDIANQTNKTATSDAHGFFSFSSLPAATYEVKFEKPGFAELRRKIVVHIADHTEIPDIHLALKDAARSSCLAWCQGPPTLAISTATHTAVKPPALLKTRVPTV
jgi:hypothetical protein